MKDWRGTEYGIGSTVLYTHHSPTGAIQQVEGTGIDLYVVYRDPRTAKWKRLTEGRELPRRIEVKGPLGARVWRETDEPAEHTVRVYVRPTGRTSCDFPLPADQDGYRVVHLAKPQNLTCLPNG